MASEYKWKRLYNVFGIDGKWHRCHWEMFMVLHHLFDLCKTSIYFYFPLPQVIWMKITSTAAAEHFAMIKKTSYIKINWIYCMSTIQYKRNKLKKKPPQTSPSKQNSFIQLHLEMSSNINQWSLHCLLWC